ncbi:sulfurtransferase-like selenium metabolism protein YedF [Hydrogenoanaerobacterium sp.]|uniref:sulfurtransferase-like selenium metabolism protein YedF n=1 Tax=Hydrogenoanaerobacterium sp. TaxID=2953763 RepID=UPI0028978731|nr:sulfurtransferase-like selenium metabolism protein YedF [Hydrogenoanaerobacterium sp.]
MINIDAKGKACPMPVIMAKKELDAGAKQLTIEVDNQIAVENLKRLGESQGFTVTAFGEGASFQVAFSADGSLVQSTATKAEGLTEAAVKADWVLFVGNEGIGSGSPELGGNLMTMLFYTLAQGNDLPKSVLFMNGGVKLPTQNEQVVEHLHTLQERGCEVLVCGTCLNYYGLSEQLKIGTVSNMYDISSRMLAAAKVISF